MKKMLSLIAATIILSGCANTTFHRIVEKEVVVDGNTETVIDKKATNENVGLLYYPPKQYLMVTRPQNKDGATTSKLVSLPDLADPMYMKFHPGFGSATMGVTFSNGMIASFNQTTDTQLDELLTSITAPVTGLATAEATRATAELTEAQASQILSQLAFEADDAVAKFAVPEVWNAIDPCSHDPAQWLPFTGEANDRFSRNQIQRLRRSMNSFACASIKAKDLGLRETAHSLDQSVRLLQLVPTNEYLDNSEAILPLFVLGKDPVAEPLRFAAKKFEKLKFDPETDANKNLAASIKQAATAILAIANELNPPKAKKPSKPPFELYELVNNGGSIKLKKVAIEP